MTKFNSKELEQIMRLFYRDADKELLAFLKAQEEARSELYNQLGEIMVTYTINNDLMAMTPVEQKKEIAKLSKWLKTYSESEARGQIALITNLLKNTAKETMSFYHYNPNREEINKIIDKHYKGKHFSSRVWENEEVVASRIKKQVEAFTSGTISVNSVKRDIQKTFNSSDYNAHRLAYTEISRVQSEAFMSFANEVGVTRVTYNAKLDNMTCNDCRSYDLKEYPIEKAPELPRHPLCRCYYEVADDIEELHIEEVKETPKEVDKKIINESDIKNYKNMSKAEQDEFIKEKVETYKSRPRKYNDLAEVKKKFEELGFETVMLEGLSPVYFDDLVNGVEVMINKYPIIKNRLKGMYNYNEFEMGVLGGYSPLYNSFMLNKKMYGTDREDETVKALLLDQLTEFGAYGTGTLYDTVIHEMGHALYFSMVDEYGGRAVRRGVLSNFWDEVGEDYFPSKYAKTDTKEYFAEMVLSSMSNTSKESVIFKKLIEEVMK